MQPIGFRQFETLLIDADVRNGYFEGAQQGANSNIAACKEQQVNGPMTFPFGRTVATERRLSQFVRSPVETGGDRPLTWQRYRKLIDHLLPWIIESNVSPFDERLNLVAI